MILIENGTIVDDGARFIGFILIDCDKISVVGHGAASENIRNCADRIIDAKGKYVIPGVIDDQVHFRDPGLTEKADIHSESIAAARGGVTSYMDMPNTNPQTITIKAWEDKNQKASDSSVVNYSFYLGATNDNINEIHNIDSKLIPGIKVFMGSSTGGMLVDNEYSLSKIFGESPSLVAIHSENESIIRDNLNRYKNRYPNGDIPFDAHPLIRSSEACIRSTDKAMELATKYGTRLHILHISTKEEISLFDSAEDVKSKKITAEACIPHIRFCNADYSSLGPFIKCNPAIKDISDKTAIRQALRDHKIDIVATDHAPHLLSEKMNNYICCPSGMPMIQHSLPVMLTEGFSIEETVNLMSNRVADLFRIKDRGYLRKGYYADIAIVSQKRWTVTKDNILYKCKWSPLEGSTLNWDVDYTIVSGKIVNNNGKIDCNNRGCNLIFEI